MIYPRRTDPVRTGRVSMSLEVWAGEGRVIGTHNGTSNSQDDEVDNEREDLLRGREPLSLVHDHPEDGG